MVAAARDRFQSRRADRPARSPGNAGCGLPAADGTLVGTALLWAAIFHWRRRFSLRRQRGDPTARSWQRLRRACVEAGAPMQRRSRRQHPACCLHAVPELRHCCVGRSPSTNRFAMDPPARSSGQTSSLCWAPHRSAIEAPAYRPGPAAARRRRTRCARRLAAAVQPLPSPLRSHGPHSPARSSQQSRSSAVAVS